MFVAFEGIDGSGKTTVSNRVVAKLREQGLTVEHVREGGNYASPLVTRLREFAKDKRNLALEPMAEMLVYLAREAQVTMELTRPALASADVVVADRYFYSYQLLGAVGRQLDAERLNRVIEAVSDGLWPDLVVLMDVDPRIGRARRKAAKIAARSKGKPEGSGSRKSLAGMGLQSRLRQGYLDLASSDPDRWLVIDNCDPDVDEDRVVDSVVSAVVAVREGRKLSKPAEPAPGPGAAEGAVAAAAPVSTTAKSAAPTAASQLDPKSLEAAPHRFFEMLGKRAQVEPATAGYLIAGLVHPEADVWRQRLADQCPHVIAYGLRGLGSEEAWNLRDRLVVDSPYHVARSLDGTAVEGERAEAMRVSLIDNQPLGVLATLDGNDSDPAWVLRARLFDRMPGAVVASLKRIDSGQAWTHRDAWVRQLGGKRALVDPELASCLASSVRGLGGDRAWKVRDNCFEAAPVAVLASLADVHDERSWQLRERWIERAPKTVLRSLVRSSDERGWAMRARMAPVAKESLDSMVADDSKPAWKLRRDFVEVWPSTAVKSLGFLYHRKPGRALAQKALATSDSDISLLKHLAAVSQDSATSPQEND